MTTQTAAKSQPHAASKKLSYALLGLAASLCLPLQAAPPALGLPLACTLGKDCWLVNLVDIDPTPTAKDYLCNNHTYNGHKGVDFAIAGIPAMQQGIAVIAAAAGRVQATRDGMRDVNVKTIGTRAVEERECGNGLSIILKDGWRLQYCHLRQGSVQVIKGQAVNKGDQLGLVGLSGRTEFPHLHLQVQHQGQSIDPFTSQPLNQPPNHPPCGQTAPSLWDAPTAKALTATTASTGVYLAGFAGQVPKADLARAGAYRTHISQTAPALVVWANIFRPDKNGTLAITIRNPKGQPIHRHTLTFPADQARRFIYSGIKRRPPTWPPGTYTAELHLTPTQGHPPQTTTITQEVR